MTQLINQVSGWFRKQAESPTISYGDSRESLIASIRKHYAIDLECGRRSRAARYQLGVDLRKLRQRIEDEEGPGTWSKHRQALFPELKERYLQKCVQFSETDGSEDAEDRIFGSCERPAVAADQPQSPPDPQTPAQSPQPEVAQTPPPGEGNNALPDPLGTMEHKPEAMPPGIRSDRQAAAGTQTPHGPVGLPSDDDEPLTTRGSLTVHDFEIAWHCPRVASAEETACALEEAARLYRAAHPAPF